MRSRRLGTKLVALAIGAAVVYTGAFLAIYVFVSARDFVKLENDRVLRGLARVEHEFTHRTDDLEALARDYALRDETRAFFLGGAPSFPSRYFDEGSLARLGFDLVAAFDAGAAPILLRLSPATVGGKEGEPNLEGAARAAEVAILTGRIRRDIMEFGGLAWLTVLAPVTDADRGGRPTGALLLGIAVDRAFLDGLSERLGLLRIDAGPPWAPPEGFHRAEGEGGEPRLLVDREAGLVRGYAVLRGYEGSPALVVGTETPREITDQAHRVGVLLVVAAPVLLLFVLAAGFATFRVLLIGPLREIEAMLESEEPGRLGEDVDRRLLAIAARGDVIGQTASVLAETRSRLRESRRLLLAANDQLSEEVASRNAELRRADHNLRLYRKIMEGTSEGVVVTELDGTIIEMNEAFCRISGYERGELLGKNPRALKSDRHAPEFYAEMWKRIREVGRWSGEIWDRRKNGEVYPKWLSIDTIRADDGEPEAYVGLSADITRIKEAEERLNRMVFYDSLTGLPNRALFRDRLDQALRRCLRTGGRAALFFIDLDRFKYVNDSFGHLAGDNLLVEMAARIKAQVRESDTVCRLGGDEFTVVLGELARSEDAGEVAAKILAAVGEAVRIGETEVFVGASLGIAVFPFDGSDSESLVKKADAAMYDAKEAGRGCYRYASGVAGDSSRKRIEAETMVRRAFARGDFFLVYQPQVSTGSLVPGKPAGLMGAEALLRLRRPDGGVAGPGEFIEIVEESGLVVPLGSWIIAEACAEAARWSPGRNPLTVAVNVSVRQFEHGELARDVRKALEASGLPAARLKLEVTESLFMRDMEKVVDTMREIRSMGVAFAIDDFGTGFSSLKYLDRLPLDCLKIDKSFIDSLRGTYEGGEIVTAVVSLARAFGLVSIAEGVETVEQLEALKRRGCDEVQGYLVSKPLEAEAFRAFAAGAAAMDAAEDSGLSPP